MFKLLKRGGFRNKKGTRGLEIWALTDPDGPDKLAYQLITIKDSGHYESQEK